MEARGIQVVKELLDARFMRYGWIGIWRTRRGLGRVCAAFAVNLIHLLGLRVKRLHVVVADGPGRRNPVVFAQLPEILLAQTVQGSAVHFGGATDKVMDLRLEWFPIGVVPGFRRDISVINKYGLGVPVQGLPLQPVAAFENEDAFSGGS